MSNHRADAFPQLRLPFRSTVIAAVVTPCRGMGEVDPSGMQRLAKILAARGCDGLFVLSSTGEMVLVDEDDRRRLVVAAREGTPAGVSLLVGIGGFGPKQAVRLARLASADGADIAVVMAPFFQRLSQKELIGYVEQIADESPIPIGVYHHLRMPTEFQIDTVARLAVHPNIVLCKDTSTDLKRMQQLVEATETSDLRLLQGSEGLIMASLQVGAHGCVSALAGIAPEWHRQLVEAFLQNQVALAEQSQRRIARLLDLFQLSHVKESLAHFVHTLKYSAVCRGWMDGSASLLPGFDPSTEFEESILTVLNDVGLLDQESAARNQGSA